MHELYIIYKAKLMSDFTYIFPKRFSKKSPTTHTTGRGGGGGGGAGEGGTTLVESYPPGRIPFVYIYIPEKFFKKRSPTTHKT